MLWLSLIFYQEAHQEFRALVFITYSLNLVFPIFIVKIFYPGIVLPKHLADNVKVLQRVLTLGDCPAGTAESACRPSAWSVWSGPMVNNVSGDAGDFSSFYLDNIERPNGH